MKKGAIESDIFPSDCTIKDRAFTLLTSTHIFICYRKHEVNKAANFKWGNEVPYDAYRVLRYNQNMSKSKTKNDPSHGHFGTKVVQM